MTCPGAATRNGRFVNFSYVFEIRPATLEPKIFSYQHDPGRGHFCKLVRHSFRYSVRTRRSRMNRYSPTIVVAMLVLCAMIPVRSSAQVRGIPDQLSDQEFWRTITEFSEPSGPYTGDNWISNEASIQSVIPPLKQLTKPGGVYLGVGPEQNFTYMWALQSKMGFIIDIRRQNMLNVLLFKALFELSPTRADFVANLFSRRRPAGLDTTTSAKALMAAFGSAPSEGLEKNIEAVKGMLAKHGYTLSGEDVA